MILELANGLIAPFQGTTATDPRLCHTEFIPVGIHVAGCLFEIRVIEKDTIATASSYFLQNIAESIHLH